LFSIYLLASQSKRVEVYQPVIYGDHLLFEQQRIELHSACPLAGTAFLTVG